MQFDKFIFECRILSHERSPAKRIQALMREIMATPTEVLHSIESFKSQVWEDPILFRSHNLLIFHSFLIPNLISPPHTHGSWAVVGLYEGQERNIFFNRENGSLIETSRKSLRPGEVVLLEPDTIHAVSNPLSTPSLALHIYGADLFTADRSMWDPWTMEESPFELNQFLSYTRTMMHEGNISHVEPHF